MDDFKKLPKMQHFKEGGHAKAKEMFYGGKTMKKGGEVDNDTKQDKALIKKAFKQHDEAEHDKEPTEIKLKKGGRSKKAVGTVKKFKVGGAVTNVYEAKKKSGDIDAIEAVKNIKPGKAAAPSRAATKPAFSGSDVAKEKSKPAGDEGSFIKSKAFGKAAAAASGAKGPDAFKKGGNVKKYADGGGIMDTIGNGISAAGTRLKNNLIGTPEQNRIAQAQMDRYAARKAAEKAALLSGRGPADAAMQGGLTGGRMSAATQNMAAGAKGMGPEAEDMPTMTMNPPPAQGGLGTAGPAMKKGGKAKKMNTGGTAC